MSVTPQDEQAQYRELRARRLAPLPGAALAWCAFAPGWPEEVVEQLSTRTLPTPLDLGLMQRAVEQRALERVPGTSPWEGSIYRMPAMLRAAAVEQLVESNRGRGQGDSGIREVRQQIVAAGMAMLASPKVAYDPVLHRWANVATAAADDGSLSRFLDARVTEALEATRQSGGVAAPEALRWIEAVEPFAQLFKGTLESAVTMARGKRELFYRRADDERRLVNYYPPPSVAPRPMREQAFHDLLLDPEHWALHYVGSGGGGKTMLLRYIANRLAPQAGAAVARVDFDFLNPDYPLREPGMLLARFAEELRLQAGPEQTAFMSFDATLHELNAWIANERAQGREGIVTVHDRVFAVAIDAFARACRRLERPVVLMLDTCEELAKLRGDRVPENVQVTFDVLMALRDEERIGQRLRVIFSGRRALGSSGFGWTAPESPLPPRPFLRLFRIRGFTELHARGFLESYRSGTVGVRRDLHDDILRLSAAIAGQADDAETARFLPPAKDDGPRFNPYDVDMYADWAASVEAVEPLTRERLERAGPHFYIEERIAKRLADDVWQLLPALTLLGRFDRQLLDALVAGSPRAAALVVEVTEQEWVRPDRSAAGDKWFIDDGLRARLRRYFDEQRPGALDAGRRRLAAVLPELTLRRPFAELAERYFVATFDALDDQPEQAAAWWLAVEQRILDEGVWDTWALPLVTELLSDPIMAPERPASFRPAVIALQAAALLHTSGVISSTSWKDVGDSIDRYPAVLGRARLRYRLECAMRQMDGGAVRQAPPDADDTQCWGALAAAMEAAVERPEVLGRMYGPTLGSAISDLGASRTSAPRVMGEAPAEAISGEPDAGLLKASPDVGIRSFGLMLQARLLVRAGQHENAFLAFMDAASLATRAKGSRWLDWLPPDHLIARTLLESLRLLGREPELDLGFSPGTIDVDRLEAVRLRQRDGDVPQRDMAIGVSPLVRPRCVAHRAIPPHDVVAAEILGRDQPAEAIERLKAISQQAMAAGMPELAVEADRAIARTIRRQRLLSENWPLPASIVSSTDPSDVRLRVVTRALHISADAAARALADQLNVIPTTFSARRRAGRRRADAEGLIEWAEIAQFTDDGRVLRALVDAEALFREVEDTRAAVRARIARVTWLARRGEREALRALLTEHPLPLAGAHFATPTNVWDAVQHPVVELLDGLDEQWRPWGVRALAAALLVADGDLTAQRTALARWVREHYAVEIDGRKHLPAEIVLVDEATGEVPGPGAVPSPGVAAPAKAGTSKVAIAIYFVIGLAVILGLVSGSFWLTSWVVPDWPTALRWVIATALFPASAWLISRGLPMALRGYGSAILASTDISFAVTLEQRPTDVNRPLSVPWSFQSRTRLFFMNTDSRPVSKPAVEEVRYEQLRQRLDLRQSPWIDHVFRLFDIVMPLKVTIEPSAAAAPWEAVFGMTAPGQPLHENRIHVYRGLTAHRTPRQSDWPGYIEMLTWLSPGVHIERSSFSFRKQARGGEWQIVSETAESVRQYDEPRSHAGVVHVIGTPVERQGAVYLQIGGVESAADSAGYLLSIEDLVRRYPLMRILVVQNTPSASLERTSSDRLEAAYLKRLGATAFQSGVPAVLVVPAIPPAVTQNIVAVLFDVLKRNRGDGRRQLITAHREIQQRIFQAWTPASTDVLSIALDCCLYAADQINLRITPDPASPVTPSSTNGAST